DLSDLEDFVYDDTDDEDYDEDVELDGFICENCGKRVYLDLNDFDDDEIILCPNCNKPLFEFDEEDSDEKEEE
ncbi:MAG TPA: hypothetical protein PLZ84_09545, partial [Clostridia bacterium]|nr:hypothetical protein [Clostridia bacterium]